MLCAAPDGGAIGICASCLEELPWQPTSVCPQCSLPSYSGAICGNCLRSAPAFDSTRALFSYDYPLSAILQRFKYQQALHIARSFSTLMLHRFINTVEADRIIPMPLHPVRLAGRGFNQSQEIARLLARHLKIPLDNSSCKRIKLAPPQASLPLKARISNMRGAFRYEQQLDGQRVLLIDDVMTTGASLNALAATVKAAGASHVECWVVARTQTKG